MPGADNSTVAACRLLWGCSVQDMHSVDVVHAAAVLTVALLAIRGAQALTEHYFPQSDAAAAARFIFGGP